MRNGMTKAQWRAQAEAARQKWEAKMAAVQAARTEAQDATWFAVASGEGTHQAHLALVAAAEAYETAQAA